MSDEVLALIEGGPGQQCELLPEHVSGKRLSEAMVALANADGGTIIVGATRRGGPAGLEAPEEARQRAVELALRVDPPLHIPVPRLVPCQDLAVLIISIPPGLPHLYAINGRFLVRSGTRNQPAAGTQLSELLLTRSGSHFESQVVEDATLHDLDLGRAAQYGRFVSAMDADPIRLLLSRGCLKAHDGSPRPNVAGLLLFGRDPGRFLPSAEILAIRYPGRDMSDEFIKEEIRGPLPEQIQRAVAFVDQMELRSAGLTGTRREERTTYPPAAVREVIVNAVAHRDYRQRGDTIRLFIFTDRIECYSPGRLPGHVTVDNIVSERFSRNEVLVQILSDLGFIERLGYGIDRMIRLMEDAGLPAPLFEETAAGFRVTLRGPASVDTAAPLPHDRGQWVHLGLNPRQEGAIRYLEQYGRITNSDMQQLYPDVSGETIRRDLSDLVARGLLLKIGEKRATFYILK